MPTFGRHDHIIRPALDPLDDREVAATFAGSFSGDARSPVRYRMSGITGLMNPVATISPAVPGSAQMVTVEDLDDPELGIDVVRPLLALRDECGHLGGTVMVEYLTPKSLGERLPVRRIKGLRRRDDRGSAGAPRFPTRPRTSPVPGDWTDRSQ